MKIWNNLDYLKLKNKTAIALGFFDGVHRGHQAVIRKVVEYKTQGYIPTVFTFTVDQIKPRLKQNSGIILTNSLKTDKIQKLGIEQLFDIPFDAFCNLSPEQFVKLLAEQLNAGLVCCGQNFHFGKGGLAGIAQLIELGANYNIKIAVVEDTAEKGSIISSTKIREAIVNGDMQTATTLLGQPYAFDHTVVEGKKLGRTINFPTINQPIPENMVLPKFGVYGSNTLLEGISYPSITNVGINPTIQSPFPLAETYILEIERNLYGTNPPVQLLKFFRTEKKCKDLQQLKQVIEEDINLLKNLQTMQ